MIKPSKLELAYKDKQTLTEAYSVRIDNNFNLNRICFQIYFPKTATFDPQDLHYIIDR